LVIGSRCYLVKSPDLASFCASVPIYDFGLSRLSALTVVQAACCFILFAIN
jgi:hypothetical protein